MEMFTLLFQTKNTQKQEKPEKDCHPKRCHKRPSLNYQLGPVGQLSEGYQADVTYSGIIILGLLGI